ncbi:methyltransferase family protein [Marinicella rhabdoformis]|uniref:methyltransferase family protein n=1 Tax=Marinicella rhabdoformis TaxID=2580566 RepID=UPI001C552630|nr:isoprenylcysteine carboxylmethyltransferase family protein [Marinicella rhabdoformis]
MNMQSLELKMPPALLVLIFASLMWSLTQLFPELSFHVENKKLWMRLIGLLGSLFIATGIYSFRRAKTTVDPTQPENATSMVQSGIYKYTRNPMYVGFLLFLTAFATVLTHALPWLLLPAFVLYMNRFQIKPEEQALLKLFGTEYEVYCQKVRRWI